MKIYCHVDLDGRAAGAIVARRYRDASVHLYNYFYDFQHSFGEVEPNEALVFVDITPNIDTLKDLMVVTKKITIIDHHGDEDLKEAGLEFAGKINDDGYGACRMVWEYYYPDRDLPQGIRWISDYDNWVRYPSNKQFQFGLSTFNTYPTSRIWDKILLDDEGFLHHVLKRGKAALEYLEPWYKQLVRSYAFPAQLGEYKALFLNQGAVDSSVFDSVEETYDIYVRGTYGKSQEWLVSLTTERDDLDLGELARQWGGGGHKKSAGLKVSDINSLLRVGVGNHVKSPSDGSSDPPKQG